jgi:hypothetical protein
MSEPLRAYVVCDERECARDFLITEWPPPDPLTLYNWGWTELPAIGKQTCLRAVLAAYEIHRQRLEETSYDRSALAAAERWVLDPSEENRKNAGRIASIQTEEYSVARRIANVAGSRRRWPHAIGVSLTGNPHVLDLEDFRTICQRIQTELLGWISGDFDPIADRYADSI